MQILKLGLKINKQQQTGENFATTAKFHYVAKFWYGCPPAIGQNNAQCFYFILFLLLLFYKKNVCFFILFLFLFKKFKKIYIFIYIFIFILQKKSVSKKNIVFIFIFINFFIIIFILFYFQNEKKIHSEISHTL